MSMVRTTLSALTALAMGSGLVAAAADDSRGNACGRIGASWRAQQNSTGPKYVDASLGYECLNSIPLHKDMAIRYVKELRPYLEWQSDLAYKKNPPSDWPFAPLDIMGEMDTVQAKLENDEYAGEYEWQMDLYRRVVLPGHDDHFGFYTDLLANALEFVTPAALVSISRSSSNSSSLPEIMFYDDIMSSSSSSSDQSSSSSAVSKINGIEASKFIEGLVYSTSPKRDVDAGYNSFFYSKALFAHYGTRGYFESGGRNRFVYPGPTTTFTFANGSSLEVTNQAKLLLPRWKKVEDAGSFANAFMYAVRLANMNMTLPGSKKKRSDFYDDDDDDDDEEDIYMNMNSKRSSSSPLLSPKSLLSAANNINNSSSPPKGPPGYPTPAFSVSGGLVSGHFLDDDDKPGYENVAILSLLSFQDFSTTEYVEMVEEFFRACAEKGKNKLVIDLQANNGGDIMVGYDLFRRLFPDIVQDGPGRWRQSDDLEAMAVLVSEKCRDYVFDDDDDVDVSSDMGLVCNQVYNWRFDLDEQNRNFTALGEKFAGVPQEEEEEEEDINGRRDKDKFTSWLQWDPANPYNSVNFPDGIAGYQKKNNNNNNNNLSTATSRPFGGPENIILLYDGYCASTCTIFSQFMRHQAGVQSIAMGGRRPGGGGDGKLNKIQGVGGVKGAQRIDFATVHDLADIALHDISFPDSTNTTTVLDEKKKKKVKEAEKFLEGRYSQWVDLRHTGTGLNVRDAVLPGGGRLGGKDDDDGGMKTTTPTQYVREESECRLFWTEEMVRDVGEVWRRAAEVGVLGTGECVVGGIGEGF